MAFKKTFVNTYHEMDQETKYRFAEMEINRALKLLTPIYGSVRALNQIIAFVNVPVQKEFDFREATQTHTFRFPIKKDEIHYLITYGQSYTKIRDITGASFNTIADLRFGFPRLYPIFKDWTPEMLHHWEVVKTTLNLFNERLIHSRKAAEADAE